MLNFFQHPHVHRWTSNEEKICLWICLTLVECNCLLIWVRGKTSLHSAAVDGRLLLCYLYSCLFPHTTPFFERVRSTYYGARFLRPYRGKRGGKQMVLLVGWAPQGCSFHWLTKFCPTENYIVGKQLWLCSFCQKWMRKEEMQKWPVKLIHLKPKTNVQYYPKN